jgi:hypothetical protein
LRDVATIAVVASQKEEMSMRTRLLAVGLTVLAMLAGSAMAAPTAPSKFQFREVRAPGWKAKIPATWKLSKTRKFDAAKPQLGLWEFKSARGNAVLRFRFYEDKGQAMKDLLEASLAKLLKRLDDAKVLTKEVDADSYTVVVEGVAPRGNFMRKFTVLRTGGRHPATKVRFAITLMGSEGKYQGYTRLFQRVIDSFEIVKFDPNAKRPPKSSTQSKPPAKPVKS